jgi:hypothetical protein
MSVSELPIYYSMKFVNLEDGLLTNEAQLWQDQTFQTLDSVVQQFINGITIPNFTTAQITAAASTAEIGTMYFNTTLNKMQFVDNTNTIQTITSV